jgi:hypothetical protein
MGSEFLKKTKRSIAKHIDMKRADLARVDFFTQTPKDQPRCALASVSPGAELCDGDDLIVESRGDRLLACKGNSIVAEFSNPPSDLLSAIADSGGLACGIVKQVNKFSKTVDVAIC